MSQFQIPSLAEARKKQEKVTRSLSQPSPTIPRNNAGSTFLPSSSSHNVTQFNSREKNKESTTTATTSSNTSKRTSAASVTSPTCNTMKRPVVINPYSKKKKKKQSNKVTTSSASGNGTVTNSSAHGNYEPNTPINQSPVLPPPSIVVGPNASFSQAFGSVDGTSLYKDQQMDSFTDKERAEQHDFDTRLAAASSSLESKSNDEQPFTTANHTNSNSNHNSNNDNDNDNPRDNHVNLQPHVLHVSTRQRGNGLLRYIRNVPYAHSKIVPDYIMSPNRCALFLSIKYHKLHPNYIHRRISELKTDFDCRILLCLVDVEDNASTLLYLNKLAVVNNLTLILSWSEEEAARYLETFKAFEGKDASSIQKREQTTFVDQVADVLSCVRSVNKTDSAQLLSQFGTFKALVKANVEELSLCPGVGEKKVKRLFEAFHKPFSSAVARKRRREAERVGGGDVNVGVGDGIGGQGGIVETAVKKGESVAPSLDRENVEEGDANGVTINETL